METPKRPFSLRLNGEQFTKRTMRKKKRKRNDGKDEKCVQGRIQVLKPVRFYHRDSGALHNTHKQNTDRNKTLFLSTDSCVIILYKVFSGLKDLRNTLLSWVDLVYIIKVGYNKTFISKKIVGAHNITCSIHRNLLQQSEQYGDTNLLAEVKVITENS